MLDINIIRNDPEKVIELLSRRGKDYSKEINDIRQLDKDWRNQLTEVEELKKRRNEVSREVGLKRSSGEEVPEANFKDMKKLSDDIKNLEASEDHKKKLDKFLLLLPNIPDEDIEPQDRIIKESSDKKELDFEVKPHWVIGEELDILDLKRAANLSGSRFAIMKGAGALLERALINFMLDVHREKFGYTEFMVPYLVRAEIMTGTGQLPKFEEDMYSTSEAEEKDKLYLIPTGEVPLANMHRGEILSEEELPKKYMAYSPCFRREAGSYGKDTSGLIRQHQFNKVELVNISVPEDSQRMHTQLLSEAEEILKLLELPYRIVELGSEDFGFSSSKTWDLEIWAPGEKLWREVSSCSNCRDFQARRMETRYRKGKGTEYVHTLNSSGVAVGRVVAAILENCQTKSGSVKIPVVLEKYMSGCTEISKT